MARPEKNTVEYFPFLCKEGKAMYCIEQKYKNDGFAAWVKLLRQLCVTNYHYLDLSNPADAMFVSAKCGVDLSVLKEIVQDLCNLGEFDKQLWEKYTVIWCPKLIESIQDAYAKRKNECITKQGVLNILEGEKTESGGVNSEKEPVNPQTKLDKTESNNIKEKKKVESDNSKEFSDEIESTYQKILQYFDPKFHPDSTVKIINWKQEIRKMNELDGLSFEKIIEIVRWARRHDMWSANVLSMKKFRRTNPEGVKYHEVFQEWMKRGKSSGDFTGGDADKPDTWFKKKDDE